MNVKEYIDQFDQISHLERHQQFVVLEQAKSAIFTGRKLVWMTALGLIIPVLLFIVIGGIIYISFGYSSWLPLAALVLTLIFSRILVSKINRATLQKGLQRVLAQHQQRSTGPK